MTTTPNTQPAGVAIPCGYCEVPMSCRANGQCYRPDLARTSPVLPAAAGADERDIIWRINDTVLKALPRHPDLGVMQARYTKSPFEVLVNVESLVMHFKDAARAALSTPAANAGQAGATVAAGWQSMTTAPKDGTMVRLLVNFSDNATEDTCEPCVTIGANNFDHDGIDEWKFAGWNWSHDCFTDGVGAPVHWMPLLDAAPASPTAAQVGAEPVARVTRLPGCLDLESIIGDDEWPAGVTNLYTASPNQQWEPVLYQRRMRPTWRAAGEGWTGWEECSKDAYEDCLRVKELNDWQYEARALCIATPSSPAIGTASIGEGWKLVPIEATPEMLREAVGDNVVNAEVWRLWYATAYRSIVAAAHATQAADTDAAPIISSYDIKKVKSLKTQFVDSLIHSGIQYRTCGAISAALNQIIDDSEAAAMSASVSEADGGAGGQNG